MSISCLKFRTCFHSSISTFCLNISKQEVFLYIWVSQVFPIVADADNSAASQCNLPLKTVSTGSVSDFWKNMSGKSIKRGYFLKMYFLFCTVSSLFAECNAGYAGDPDATEGYCEICGDGYFAELGQTACTHCGDNANTNGMMGRTSRGACC